MNVGYNLKKIREREKFTQRELAIAANCTTAYISQIERGTKSLSLIMAYTFAKILNCSLYDFINQ